MVYCNLYYIFICWEKKIKFYITLKKRFDAWQGIQALIQTKTVSDFWTQPIFIKLYFDEKHFEWVWIRGGKMFGALFWPVSDTALIFSIRPWYSFYLNCAIMKSAIFMFVTKNKAVSFGFLLNLSIIPPSLQVTTIYMNNLLKPQETQMPQCYLSRNHAFWLKIIKIQ